MLPSETEESGCLDLRYVFKNVAKLQMNHRNEDI
jgi:hypothetical protein